MVINNAEVQHIKSAEPMIFLRLNVLSKTPVRDKSIEQIQTVIAWILM